MNLLELLSGAQGGAPPMEQPLLAASPSAGLAGAAALAALRPGPQPPGGLPADPMATQLPRPAPARVTELEADKPTAFDEEFSGGNEMGSPKPKPMRGYRISFGGQTFDVDPAAVAEKRRMRVVGALAPMLENAGSPEEKSAALTAIQSAAGSIGTLTPAQAVTLGVKLYQDELDRGAKEKRARILGGGGGAAAGPKGYGGTPGLTREGNQVQSGLFDDTNTWLNGFESKHGVQKVREAMQAGDKVAGLLAGDNPVAQRAALTATLKQWFSSVTSNTELAFVTQSAGVINQLMMELNKYGDEGRLPAGFIAKLKGAVQQTQKEFRRHMHELGVKAASEYMSNGNLTSRMSPEQTQSQADMVFGRFTGVYPKTYRPQGAKKAAGGGEAAPKEEKAAPKAAPRAPPSNDPKERARRLLGR